MTFTIERATLAAGLTWATGNCAGSGKNLCCLLRVALVAGARVVGYFPIKTRSSARASGAMHDTSSLNAYQEILRQARRFVQSEAEAHDLVQDALTIALSRGFTDWSAPSRRPWLRGVLRKRAAHVVRTERRRRSREQVALPTKGCGRGSWAWKPEFLASLPPSLRAVATLVNADLCATEIRWLLNLSRVAWRSRLCALKKAVQAEAEPPTIPVPDPALGAGARRATLLAGLKRVPDHALSTHDPDGHAILFRIVAHKTAPAATVA